MAKYKIERPDFKFKRETGSNGLQAYVLAELRDLKPYVKAVKVVKANEQGVSDILMCVEGKFVAVELKTGNNTASAHQNHFIEEVVAAGGIGGIAYTWREVKEIINKSGFDIDAFKTKKQVSDI